jgi:hypothetical protein
VEAGLNVRCTFRSPDSYVLPLRELVREGAVSMKTIDERVRDVLRVKFLTGLFDHPYVSEADMQRADTVVNGAEHNKTALRASLESLILLKNNGLLPLDASKLRSVAVIGPNADEDGYAHVHYGPQATESVTVFAGLKKALEGKARVRYAKGCEHVDSQWPDSEIYGFTPTKEELRGIREAVRLARDEYLHRLRRLDADSPLVAFYDRSRAQGRLDMQPRLFAARDAAKRLKNGNASLKKKVAALQAKNDILFGRLVAAKKKAMASARSLEAMRSSLSWRFAAPLRAVARLVVRPRSTR